MVCRLRTAADAAQRSKISAGRRARATSDERERSEVRRERVTPSCPDRWLGPTLGGGAAAPPRRRHVSSPRRAPPVRRGQPARPSRPRRSGPVRGVDLAVRRVDRGRRGPHPDDEEPAAAVPGRDPSRVGRVSPSVTSDARAVLGAGVKKPSRGERRERLEARGDRRETACGGGARPARSAPASRRRRRRRASGTRTAARGR